MIHLGTRLSLAAGFVALGLFAGEAKAVFLVQVTETINAPIPKATTVGGSTVTLSSFISQPGDVDLTAVGSPIHLTYGATSVTSTTPVGSSDAFNIGYNYTLTFTHVGTGSTATLTGVTGTISGNVASNGSTLNNTYTGGPVTLPATIILDGRVISVRLDPYTPPGTPPDTNADFSVALFSPNSTPQVPPTVPEPTTMALMGVGGLLLIASRLRRRKATADLS